MHMRRTAAVGVAVAVGLGGAAVTSASSPGQRGDGVEVLRTTSEETSRVFQDLDDSGSPSPGDNIVLAADIRRNGQVIGHNVAKGTVTRVIGQRILWNFWSVTSLPGGEITLHGVFDSAAGAGPHRYAITGGTGKYRRARGQVVYHVSDNGARSTGVTRIIH